MEEPYEIPKNGFCYACLSRNDEKHLYLHSVQNETLKAIFQVNSYKVLCRIPMVQVCLLREHTIF